MSEKPFDFKGASASSKATFDIYTAVLRLSCACTGGSGGADSLGITWKKQRDRGKKIFYVHLDKKKIGRATAEAGVPLVVQKHLKKLSAGDHTPPLFRLHCILMMDVCMGALTIMSCVSKLTISCMCKLAHATCVIICDAVDEASGLGEAVKDGEAAGGSSRETRRDPVLQPKPVASSSRRRFEENYDDVMRSCETGENATH